MWHRCGLFGLSSFLLTVAVVSGCRKSRPEVDSGSITEPRQESERAPLAGEAPVAKLPDCDGLSTQAWLVGKTAGLVALSLGPEGRKSVPIGELIDVETIEEDSAFQMPDLEPDSAANARSDWFALRFRSISVVDLLGFLDRIESGIDPAFVAELSLRSKTLFPGYVTGRATLRVPRPANTRSASDTVAQLEKAISSLVVPDSGDDVTWFESLQLLYTSDRPPDSPPRLVLELLVPASTDDTAVVAAARTVAWVGQAHVFDRTPYQSLLSGSGPERHVVRLVVNGSQ